MIDIPSNYGKNSNYKCGEKETMSYIYKCNLLNKTKENINFEKIYNGRLTEQEEIWNDSETVWITEITQTMRSFIDPLISVKTLVMEIYR